MNRPILIACIGTIIGIIGGLYFSLSTISFFLMGIFCAFVFLKIILATLGTGFKLVTKVAKRFLRYFKVAFRINIIIVFIISILVSFFYVKIRDINYQKVIPGEIKDVVAEIKSDSKENKYTYSHRISINGNLYMLYLKKKKGAKEFEYGDIIKLDGKLELPEEARNYAGYSQSNNFKANGLYGIIYAEKAEIIGKKFSIGKLGSIIRESIKKKLYNYISEENANVLLGILIGDKSELKNNTLEDFRKSSLIHILCVSRSTCWFYHFMDSKNLF